MYRATCSARRRSQRDGLKSKLITKLTRNLLTQLAQQMATTPQLAIKAITSQPQGHTEGDPATTLI